jgi:peptidoglycan/LPS O-acetylase OafA/YrhL
LLTIWPTFALPAGIITSLLLKPFTYGHYAVDAFIVLSGYCLMLPVSRNNGELKGGAWRFFGKRARRILPPYYASVIISCILIWLLIGHKTGTHWDVSLPITWGGILSHLFMLQGFNPKWDIQINHALWSIPVEWWIYFLFPLLVFGMRRFGGTITTITFIIVGIAVAHVTPNQLRFGLSPQYIGLFALGAYSALASTSESNQWSEWRTKLPWGTIIFVTFAIVMGLVHASFIKHFQFMHLDSTKLDTLFGTWTALLLFATSRPDFALTRTLSWRPLVSIGTFAYSLYLIHAPLLQIVWQYGLHPLHLGDRITFALLAGVGTPLIVGVAYLFFLAFEKPFMTVRKNETPAEVARDAALSPAP